MPYTLICMRILAEGVGFEWDDGNRDKNLKKHSVTNAECEEAFADDKKLVRSDVIHSQTEARHYLIGKTNGGRILFMSFTIRKEFVRIISARDINRKERSYYGN